MNTKLPFISMAAVAATALLIFLAQTKKDPINSEYSLLASANHENFGSDGFYFSEVSDELWQDPSIKKSVRTALAPAINTVALGKFLNGNLPTTTPNGNAGVPTLLSQTGAFTNLSTLSPSPGLIPYDMIEPFWSDGADKKRWMAIPNDGSHNSADEQITYSSDEAWDFPRGAVLIKHFELAGKRLETRFGVKGDDDVYYYLTYKWNNAQTDATLLNGAVDEVVVVNGVAQTWHYPSRNECTSCHIPQNGSVLGPKTRNLNKSILYPSSGTTMNQLVNLSEMGILTENITNANVNNYPAVAAKDDLSRSLQDRARSYLDVNCASCHNPNVQNVALFDARYTTPIENQNLIYGNVIYDEGLNDPKVVIPQDVYNSMAHFRMNSTETGIEMPPLAKDVVDTEGVELIAEWINSLTPATTSPPVAAFNASTTFGAAPLSVSFDASASYDEDNDSLNYTWNFGDGTTGQGQTTSHVYNELGTYNASLTVSDGEFSDVKVTTIVVDNSNPGSNTVSFSDGTSLIGQDNFSGLPMGVIDMNGDGKDDIVQFNSAKNLRIQYQNGGGQQFTTHSVGQVSSNNQWGTVIADFDHNGFNDIMSGGAYDNLKIIKNNNGNDSYTQSTLGNSNIFLQGSNFVDINNDGWADIFACHDDAESRPFENNQNGTLTYNANLIRTSTTPSSDDSGNYASMWVDYDNDGDVDLYISKCRGGVNSSSDPRRINMLWQNDGNNNFVEVAAQANLKIGDQTWLSDFGDIDNDGDLDAIVINHGTGPNLMRNNGNGTFTEITSTSGLLPTLDPQDFYGIQGFFRDFNNDGHLDLMVSGDNHYIFYNNGDGTFQNAPNPFNSNQIQSFSVGDLNHDGFLDIYAGYASGLNSPTSTKDRIWLNDGNENNFINIQLKGTQSNINGIGARVELYGAWGIQIRDVRSGEGYGLVNSFTQHFGIGTSTTIDRVIVRWPSGVVDEVSYPAPNQFLAITESLPEPTCSDGIQNGDETGIDCGGSCSTPCPCEGEELVSIDFENGSGTDWVTSGDASTGTFIIDDPTSQTTSGVQTQPEDDHSAQGANALFTATNSSAGSNDVDNGISIVTSPVFPIQEDAKLSIWYFFGQRDAGDDAGDYFRLEYSTDGGNTYEILASHADETVIAEWTEAVADIAQGSNLVIKVSAADGSATGDIIEAGIDDLTVIAECVDPIAVTGISVNPENETLTVGETLTITETITPADASDQTVTWSSNDEAVVIVDANGLVTAISEGNATITATTNDGSFSAMSQITVEAAIINVTGIEVAPTTVNLTEGNTQLLTATISPADASDQTVIWSSNDEAIAEVDSNGLVTAISEGNATITATTNDGSFSAMSQITVEAAIINVTGIEVAPTTVNLTEGDTQLLTATISPADASDQTIIWSSNDQAVAIVDANGLVTAIAEGDATITVTTNDGNFTATTTILVNSDTECTPSNVALAGTASQSSTYGNGQATLAIDGNTSASSPWSADLQHTQNEAQPWWQLDLGAEYSLENLTIFNRSDGFQDRLNNFYVLVSSAPFPVAQSLDDMVNDPDVSAYLFTGAAGAQESFSLQTQGRYIRVQLQGNGFLHMAEVQVMGCFLNASPCDGEPVVDIAPAGPFLDSDPVQTLTGTPAGGTWSGASTDGTFDPSIGTGTYSVTYTYDNGRGCVQSDTIDITVQTGNCVLSNVALAGTASQSSTYGNGEASLAIDGNTSGSSPWSADLQHTQNEAQPWWQLDLGAEHSLENLTIFNRSDRLQDRLNNFYILVSNSPFEASQSLNDLLNDPDISAYQFSGTAGAQESFSLQTQGRYIRIHLQGNGILHMAEVQVMGCFLNASPCDGEPAVVINPTGPFLDSDPVQTLTGTPAGGIWSGASTDGTFDPSIGAGTYSVTYTYDNGQGCVQSDTMDIVVQTTGPGDCVLSNVALGGTASQSSTYGNGEASLAIDGNTSGSSPWSADLQHTQNEAQPWWQLDLGADYNLGELTIFNRTNGFQERLNNFYILVSSSPFEASQSLNDLLNDSNIASYQFNGAAGAQESFDIQTQGRYIRIQLQDNGILHMAEVQVMGCLLPGSTPLRADIDSYHLNIAPNPASDTVKISIDNLNEETEVLYNIYSTSGVLIYSFMGSASEQINVNSFASGIYTIVGQSSDGTASGRLIIRR